MPKSEASKRKKSAASVDPIRVLNRTYEAECPIDRISLFDGNPRQGDCGAIHESVKHNGFYGALIVQESTGKILAGNHRYMVAKQMGFETIPVVWVSCDDAMALRILATDNRVNDLADYSQAALAQVLERIKLDDTELGFLGTGWDEESYQNLLNDLAGLPQERSKAGLTDDDEVPEAPAEPVSKLGDLWILGEHRVLCESSTNVEKLRRLFLGNVPEVVFADPPYGIAIVKGSNKGSTEGGGGATKFGKVGGGGWVESKTYAEIANDENTNCAREFVAAYQLLGIKHAILWGGNYFTDFLPPSACWLVWDKQNTGNFADVELAWTSFNKGAKLYSWLWNGLSRAGDRKTELLSRVHPTQKPVGLFELIFKDFEFNSCFDGFLGSGSTLIACEKTQRACYGCELSPAYVDVIVHAGKTSLAKPQHWKMGAPLTSSKKSAAW